MPSLGKSLGEETGKETHIGPKIPHSALGVRMEPEVGAVGDWGRSFRQFSGEKKAPRGSREKAGVSEPEVQALFPRRQPLGTMVWPDLVITALYGVPHGGSGRIF